MNIVRNSMRLLSVPFVASLLVLSGCKVGPDFAAPQSETPAAWVGTLKTPAGVAWKTNRPPADLAQWWRGFNDPELTALVQAALQTNLDLQLAEAALRQARAARGVVAGGLWPGVTASGSYVRQHSGAATAGPPGDHNFYQAGLDALWELDIFGGVRRNVESANANIQALREDLRDVQVSLAAEVALNYLELRGFQQQIAVAQDNLKAQEHTAGITRQKFDAGFVSALDVANADAQVASTKSVIPVLEASARQRIYALGVLLTRPPGALLKELSGAGPLPVTPLAVPLGLPSDLLRRRPDIRAAEARLHAATAQVGVAVADFFPKFSLTGSLSYQNSLVEDLFAGGSRFSSFGPAASWPIFQGGSIAANVRMQKALRDQSYIAYQKTVLSALQDVESALVAFDKEWDHRTFLSNAVTANRKAVSLSMQLYSQGQTDFLNVLNAQRSLFAAEDALVQSNESTATDLIAVYKALGGGWEDEPLTASQVSIENSRMARK
jgi:NodT family efflux transporter outer membrane factor (OMF) lipoprotein